MILTNAQRANLIDALTIAIEDRMVLIDSMMPPRRKEWSAKDKRDFAEWDAQIKRFRKLRRSYLFEEKHS